MALTFTQSDLAELWDSTAQSQSTATSLDEFESLSLLPPCLGTGYTRHFELAPGMYLGLIDREHRQSWSVQVPAHNHLIQIGVLLSGVIDAEGAHPTLGGSRAYFSGSGISPGYRECHYPGQRLTMVNVEIEPDLLEPLFGEEGHLGKDLKTLLCKGQDWKASFYPTLTLAMRSLAQQIWHVPYHGMARRMFLQAKVWELLAMQIDLVMTDQAAATTTIKLRPDTVARLHYAKDILTQQLEHSPLLSEVAQQVGVSDRTLRRGFQELFGTTPLGYLTQQRMLRAQYLLQQGTLTVAEVARTVGYGHLGHFATAFKREFGIPPSACISGKMSVLGL
jgi:AraC-like DNA-binding protein